MKDSNFSDRLNLALNKEGFPPKNRGRIQLLAEMVGLSHRGASKWVNGETCPPAKKYAALAEKLNVREEWLRQGIGEMIPESQLGSHSVSSNSDSTDVTIYNIDTLLASNPIPIGKITCDVKHEGDLIAVKLNSEAMSPRFPMGSIAVLDKGKKPMDGDFVLVEYESFPSPIFRQLLIANSQYYLNANNPKFDRLILTKLDSVIGTLIQAVISFN